MRLSKPGLYRVVGEEFELLINVVGEYPLFRIVNAVSINTLIQKSKVEELTEDSIEVQSIVNNPDAFVFLEWEYSDVCTLPPYRKSIRGTKMPEINEDLMNSFVQRYKLDVSVPNRGIAATKMFIMQQTGWTLAQSHLVALQIAKKVKNGNL